MIKRIIDISEPAYLRTEKKQLLIDREGTTVATVPIEDLGVLILPTSSHRDYTRLYTPMPAKQRYPRVLR